MLLRLHDAQEIWLEIIGGQEFRFLPSRQAQVHTSRMFAVALLLPGQMGLCGRPLVKPLTAGAAVRGPAQAAALHPQPTATALGLGSCGLAHPWRVGLDGP